MRDSMKITIPYQFGHVLLTHLGAVGIAFVFQMVAFWYFIGRNGLKEAISIVFIAVYAGMIYHAVHKLATFDYKDYTPLKPSVFKGAMFGVCIAVVTIAIFLLWKWVWANSADETGLVGIGALAVNILFTFWTFPYYGILGASNGVITVVGLVMMIVVPIVASTAGYLAGKYKIDMLDKIERFSYEKSEEE